MSDKCGVCGRTDGLNSTGTMCFRPSFTDEDAVAAACYKLGYYRSQAALAAARRECEGLRTALEKYDAMMRGYPSPPRDELIAMGRTALAAPAAGEGK